MKNYEVNDETLLIIPDGEHSKIYEGNMQIEVDDRPYKIMEDSCNYFGSSLEGRKIGSQNLLGSTYKVPVVVEERHNLIFFPTLSPMSEDCCWINASQVKDYKKDGSNTKVLFHNGVEYTLPISLYSFQNQLYRSNRLNEILRYRTQEKR